MMKQDSGAKVERNLEQMDLWDTDEFAYVTKVSTHQTVHYLHVVVNATYYFWPLWNKFNSHSSLCLLGQARFLHEDLYGKGT